MSNKLKKLADAISPPPQEELSREVNGDDQVITLKSRTIRTLDAALAEAEVDTTLWEVDRYTVNKWDQGQRAQSGARVIELWQVKIWLKRRVPKPITDGIEAFFAKLPMRRKKKPRKRYTTKDPHMLELALFDLHLGKLAWEPETGSAYDTKRAIAIYAHAVCDLLERVKGYNVATVVVPIGQDFFHINNWVNTTVNNTPQDVDTRFQQIFTCGLTAVVQAIDRCLQCAPVHIIWTPGNHDRATSWYLVKCLEAYYRNCDAVHIDAAPDARKYIHYGNTLLGFTHGDEEPHRDLPAIMAAERPGEWAQTKSHYWHLGHFHKKKQMHYNAGDSWSGVTVQVIPSLSGTDAWHYRKGYVRQRRAAEAYLWSKEEGFVGQFAAYVRKEKP